MSQQVFPTKGNLIATKKSLDLAKMGFDLLDRKRNILIREMMQLIDEANAIQSQIDSTYAEAYLALQRANLTLGVCGEIAETVPVENGVSIEYQSVMGVAIPTVFLESALPQLHYGFNDTNAPLDEAYIKFDKVKRLTARLAEVENCVYRLANAIKKTQKRANALRNIIIPRFTETVKYITLSLDEKDREEFSRLKVIKANKLKKSRRAE